MSKIELISHKISADETGNSTKTLLTSSATFTGAWEDVTNYSTVAVALINGGCRLNRHRSN